MVPGSTLMYGCSWMLVPRMPRDSRIAAREAAAMPFPKEETTPPVTKTYLVIYLGRVGMEKLTGMPDAPQIVVPFRQCGARNFLRQNSYSSGVSMKSLSVPVAVGLTIVVASLDVSAAAALTEHTAG